MNIRQVRKKIKSVGNVKKITRAMQLVSAIKMKKAQEEAIEGRPFRDTLKDIMGNITKKADTASSPLLTGNQSGKTLVILISTNKGLCGAFNFNLFRFCLRAVEVNQSDFITVGKKGAMLLTRLGGTIIADFSAPKPITSVSAVFSLSVSKFLEGAYGKVILVYNQCISSFKFEPVIEQILPVSLPVEEKELERREEYTVEPSAEEIMDNVLRTFVEEKIRGALLNSEAGEHSARMMAMKNATDNATDLIYEFTLLRNKLRQEKITYELLDMITAKESVEAG